MRKYILALAIHLFVCQSAISVPILKKNSYMIATYYDNNTGVVGLGSKNYPLVYFPDVTSEEAKDSIYWIIKNVEGSLFTFQNAATLQYIKYDKAFSDRSALRLVDTLQEDGSTTFFLEPKTYNNLSYYLIHPYTNTNKIWNRRTSTSESYYPVGVYSGSGSSYECFIFYDSEGNSVQDDGVNYIVPPSTDQTLGAFKDYADTLTFNEKIPAVSTSKKEFYLTIPESQMGYDIGMKIHFQLKDTTNRLYIDDILVHNDSVYIFSNVSGTAKYTVDIRKNSTVISSGTIYFSCLPFVQLYSDQTLGTVYSLGRIVVTSPDKPGPAEKLYSNIRVRGGLSSTLTKKSYALNLKDSMGVSLDRSFLGLRKDNNWILDAMSIDQARMRNRVSTDLWNDFATRPYYASEVPGMINGTRGGFVEVFLNDKYNGLYCLTEKIDRKQLKLKEIEMNPTVQHGALYKASDWTIATLYGKWNGDYPSYNNASETWCGYEVKYPEMDEGQPIRWNLLYRATYLPSSHTNDQTFVSKVAAYFDLPVYLDYYLFLELLLATDNQGKNTYLSIYDQAVSSMISVTPWDLDGTWGRTWSGVARIANQDFDTYLNNYEPPQNGLFVRLKSLNYDGYNEKRKERYRELRGSYFSEDQLIKRFVTYGDIFIISGAGNREKALWGCYAVLTERNYISNWIKTRLAYLDKQYLGGPYTDLENVFLPQFEIYPNPVYDYLIVSKIDAGETVQILNLQGSCMLKTTSEGKSIIIDMSSISPGLYFVKVGETVNKIIKR